MDMHKALWGKKKGNLLFVGKGQEKFSQWYLREEEVEEPAKAS